MVHNPRSEARDLDDRKSRSRSPRKTIAQQTGIALALQNGFRPIEEDRFVRDRPHCKELLVLGLNWRIDAWEMTPSVGVQIPALDQLTSLCRRDEEPPQGFSLGGPLFRFADLTAYSLSDFYVDFSKKVPTEASIEKLHWLWRSFGAGLLVQFSDPSYWVTSADVLIEQPTGSSINLVRAARTVAAIKFVSAGSEAAHRALRALCGGGDRRPEQDIEEAHELLAKLDAHPALAENLRQAITP